MREWLCCLIAKPCTVLQAYFLSSMIFWSLAYQGRAATPRGLFCGSGKCCREGIKKGSWNIPLCTNLCTKLVWMYHEPFLLWKNPIISIGWWRRGELPKNRIKAGSWHVVSRILYQTLYQALYQKGLERATRILIRFPNTEPNLSTTNNKAVLSEQHGFMRGRRGPF